MSAQEPSHKIGTSLSSLIRSGKRTRLFRSFLPWRQNIWKGYSANMRKLRKSNDIPDPGLPWSHKI